MIEKLNSDDHITIDLFGKKKEIVTRLIQTWRGRNDENLEYS